MHICKYKLQKIAYCSDDCGAGHKIFAFIAKKGDAKKTDTFFQCYCFETQNLVRLIVSPLYSIRLSLAGTHDNYKCGTSFSTGNGKISRSQSGIGSICW